MQRVCKEHISRKLDCGVEGGLNPRPSGMGCGCPTRCQTLAPHGPLMAGVTLISAWGNVDPNAHTGAHAGWMADIKQHNKDPGMDNLLSKTN